MSGGVLLVPFFLIRFGLLALLDRSAVGRAAHFAPVYGGEKLAYGLYQVSNAAIILYVCFLEVAADFSWLFWLGVVACLLGLAACAVSVASFAAGPAGELHTEGAYRFSRNPMYAAYFILFIGWAVLTRSPVLFGIVLVFQISSHWIVLAEERWCREQFGEAYREYAERVRRYI